MPRHRLRLYQGKALGVEIEEPAITLREWAGFVAKVLGLGLLVLGAWAAVFVIGEGMR